MKRGSTFFLKGCVILVGIAVLALCIFFLFVGFGSTEAAAYYRPLLIGICIPAFPFFIALYQALKLLSYIDSNIVFSDLSVQALKNIKYCAITISVLYALGMPYILYVAEKDDAPGAVAIALVIIFASTVISVFAAVLQRLLQNAIEIQSENDLTV